MSEDATRTDSAERFAVELKKKSPGFLWELWAFLRYNKRWWLAPIIIVLLLLGLLVILGGTAAAPLIYPFV